MSTLSWIKNGLNVLERNKLEACGTTCPCDTCYPMPVYVYAYAPSLSLADSSLYYSNKYHYFIDNIGGSWAYSPGVYGCKCEIGKWRAAYAYGWQPLLYHFPWYFAAPGSRECLHVLTSTMVWRSEFWKFYDAETYASWLLLDACGEHRPPNVPCNMFTFVSCNDGDYTFCDSPTDIAACAAGEPPEGVSCCESKTITPLPPLTVSASEPAVYDEVGYAWEGCFATEEEATAALPVFGLKFAKFQLWWKLWDASNPGYSWRDLYETEFETDAVYEVELGFIYSGIKYPYCCHQTGICTEPIFNGCPSPCSDQRTYVVYTFNHTEFTVDGTTYHAMTFDGNNECSLQMDVFADADDSLLNTITTTVYGPPTAVSECPPVPCDEWTDAALIARALELFPYKWEYKGVLVKKDGNPYTDIIKLDGSDARVVSSGRFEDDCGLSASDVACEHCAEDTTMVLVLVYTDEPITEDSDPVCGYAYYCISGDIEDEYYGSCYNTNSWTEEIYDDEGVYCGRLVFEAVARPEGSEEGYRDLPPGDPNTFLDIKWTVKDGSPRLLESVSVTPPDKHCMDGSTLAYCAPCLGLRIIGSLTKNCSGDCSFDICLPDVYSDTYYNGGVVLPGTHYDNCGNPFYAAISISNRPGAYICISVGNYGTDGTSGNCCLGWADSYAFSDSYATQAHYFDYSELTYPSGTTNRYHYRTGSNQTRWGGGTCETVIQEDGSCYWEYEGTEGAFEWSAHYKFSE